MHTLSINLLGAPEVLVDDRPIAVDTRKAIATLALLAAERRPLRRESLAAMFWPDHGEQEARRALRRTLSALRRGLGGAWLESDRDRVDLPLDSGLSIDIVEYRGRLDEMATHAHAPVEVCPACIPVLQSAVALYRGDFLAGFTLRDSPEFDDWQRVRAEEFRRAHNGALQRLATGLSARGDLEGAIAAAAAWSALDPLDEAAHRMLMVLHAWTGNRSRALVQYAECRRFLQQELGVDPLDETVRLYAAIEEDRLPPAPGGRPEPVAVPFLAAGHLPFLGRDAELASMVRAVDLAPGGGAIVIEGEAGIGKTRLLTEFLGRLTGAVRVTAHPGDDGLPFGVVIAVLRAAIGDPVTALARIPERRLAEASRLLPELADAIPGLPLPAPMRGPGAKARFFEALTHVLLDAEGAPHIIAIDDLHHADAASIEFFRHLLRRLAERKLWLVATWTTDHVPASHPLRRWAREAERVGRATIVALDRLGRDTVGALVAAVEPDRDADFADALYKTTDGVPLLVAGYLDAASGGELPETPPDSVGRMLHGKLDTLGTETLDALVTAAVLGRPFDLDLLVATTELDEPDAEMAVVDLMERGLLTEREAPGGAVLEFSHTLLGEAAYRLLSSARRRRLHRRVADALATRARAAWDPGAGAAVIADHYRRGGRPAEAANLYRLAGDHARALSAIDEAADHYAAALELGHPEPGPLHEALGDMQALRGEYGSALERYERAEGLTSAEASPRLGRKRGDVYVRLGAWELADRAFAEAAERLAPDAAADRSLLAADRSYAGFRRGDLPGAAGFARTALDLAEVSGDPLALAQAHNLQGILAARRGHHDAAARHLERSLDLADAIGDVSAQVASLNNLALNARARGQAAGGIQLLEQAIELCARVGDRHREAALRNNLADLHREAGHTERAMDELKQAAALFADIGREPGAWEPEIWKLREW